MKTCINCTQEKELSEFSFRYKDQNIYQNTCKVCSRKNNKKHYDNNKDYYIKRNKRSFKDISLYIEEYKSKRSCIKCGENHIACLDFHHINPENKSFTIALGKTKGIKAIKKEIEKCELLCANCHRKLHYDNKNF